MTLPTSSGLPLVVFTLDEQRYAVDLDRVVRVLPMLELAAVPAAPDVVAGMFSLAGQPVPAMQIRRRFRLPDRGLRLSDQLLVVQTWRRRLALIVDHVDGIETVPAEAVAPPATVAPGLEQVRGILTLPGSGVVFLHDIDAFLSADEETRLTAALEVAAQ